MLVVNRFRVPERGGEAFRADLERRTRRSPSGPGTSTAGSGRNLDDPTLWMLMTTWEHVGAYRRALSAYDVKLHAVPLLSRALDEPSAYETVEPGDRPQYRIGRGR